MPNSTTNQTVSGSARAMDLRQPSLSEYHQSCVPAQDRERAANLAAALLRRAATSTSASLPSSLAVVINGNAVRQDRLWTRAVRIEKQSLKEWLVKYLLTDKYDDAKYRQ